ncbi:MAG: 6-hydroxycyclohex-1-ene-1-carbonyl-CoA dehydrogenase [Planctomycetota bacterium]
MRAVGEPLVAATREFDAPADGQALVEVFGCGVCHTDLGFLYDGVRTRHELPLVLGHEVAGQVVAQGASHRNLVGKKVIVPAVMPCGSCDLCQRGRGDICKSQIFPGNDDHGGFASHLVVPVAGLCEVPDGDFDRDGLARLSVVADAVSTSYEAVRKSGLGKGDFAIFVGAGGVGGFGIQTAHALGARVLAIDVSKERLDLMKKHGAEWCLNATEFDPKALKKQVRGTAKEAGLRDTEWKVFETSGTQPGQETAFSLLTFGAYLGVVGYYPGSVNLRLSNIMAFAARAEGTWGCPPEQFPSVLDLVRSGKIAIDPFLKTYPMSSINDVFEKLRRHELSHRPVLIPDFPS